MLLFLKKIPIQRRSEQGLKAILKANIQLLEDEEYDQITIDKIVEYSGVASGSIYQYFESKKNILRASIYFFFEEIMLESLKKHKEILNSSKSKEELFENSLKLSMSIYFTDDLKTKQIFRLVIRLNLLQALMPLREKYCIEVVKLSKNLLKDEITEKEAYRLLFSATASFFGINDTIACGYFFPGTRQELRDIFRRMLFPLFDYVIKDFSENL